MAETYLTPADLSEIRNAPAGTILKDDQVRGLGDNAVRAEDRGADGEVGAGQGSTSPDMCLAATAWRFTVSPPLTRY